MPLKKIISIVGTRPQLIKQAALEKAADSICSLTMVYTGQHSHPSLYSDVIQDLRLSPPLLLPNSEAIRRLSADYRLAAMTEGISRQLEALSPDAVVVMGDTDSTLAGALAAHRKKIPLIHLEAGERCGNFDMPEEWNRVLTDQLSSLLCCASTHAVHHLENEKVKGSVIYTGDLMKDLLLQQTQKDTPPPFPPPYYLLTLHRNYTQVNGQSMKKILQSMQNLDAPVVFPVHPSTQKSLEQHQLTPLQFPNLVYIPPLSYTACIGHLKHARLLFTDSGGLQKEAYWLRKQCITIRKETEWKETLEGNWNTLWYNLNDPLPVPPLPKIAAYNDDLYGDGNAGEQIFSAIANFL